MERFLVGRRRQVRELKEALASSKPEMVALTGRRRVGKTYLVRQVYGDRIDFELTGLQNGKMNSQLQNFVFAMGKYFPHYKFEGKPSSWLEAFHELEMALDSAGKSEKIVVFLDELPWLGGRRSGFTTALGYFWNTWASRRNVVLVICGSAASWMIKKVINDRGGLHNRVTRLLFLPPFTLAETEEYCRHRKINLDRFHLLQIYMVMGGIPMYLDQLRPGLSAVQNIQEICFDTGGYLRDEFERLFSSLFENHHNHISIIRALASRKKGLTRQEIIKATSFTNGGMLSGILDELEKSGFIAIYGGFGKKVKESLYRLTDFYSHFYLTFIEPQGKHSKADFVQLSDLPKWRTWSGYAFENVCLIHPDQIKKALGISGVATSIASFIASPADGLSGAQIDLLIDRSDQVVNLCEMKFSVSEYEVTKQDVQNFASKKAAFRYHSRTNKHLFLTLVTTFGAIQNSNRLNHVDQVVTQDDLFAE